MVTFIQYFFLEASVSEVESRLLVAGQGIEELCHEVFPKIFPSLISEQRKTVFFFDEERRPFPFIILGISIEGVSDGCVMLTGIAVTQKRGRHYTKIIYSLTEKMAAFAL